MKKKDAVKSLIIVSIAMLCVFLYLKAVVAVPTEPIGPKFITVEKSTRLDNLSYGPKTTWAEAGNVTELSINATTPTRAWQGYYGNITGKITLDDSNNNTLYDWTDIDPKGEIFASINSSINWPTIRCFNLSGPDAGNSYWTPTTIYGTTENNRTGITDEDSDSINATFNWTVHKQFNVGTVIINQSMCPMTATYVNNASKIKTFDTVFVELLLTDGSSPGGNALVFTTFIENDDTYNNTDVVGFDNYTHDFQMLVLEDGHPGAQEDERTLYYFWVELG